MGEPKSRLRVGEQPMLRFLHDRVAWDGPTLLVSAPDSAPTPGAEAFNREVHDPFAGGGPAQGLLTALLTCETDLLLLTAVDMPLLARMQLDELCAQPIERGRLCVRRSGHEEMIEPFPSLFHRSIAPALEDLLSQNRRSLHGLLRLEGVARFDASHWPTEAWTNLNTPADYQRFTREFASAH